MPTIEFQEFNLPRTGDRTLAFTGKLIFHVKSPSHKRTADNPNTKNHWFESWLYQTKGGSFVLHIGYRWSGKIYRETIQDFVYTMKSQEEIKSKLTDFEPTDCVTGYPEGDHWAEKQSRLMNEIDNDYNAMVELIEDRIAKMNEPERIE